MNRSERLSGQLLVKQGVSVLLGVIAGCSVVLFSVNAALSQLSDHVLSLLAEGFKIVWDEINECS